MNIFQFGLKESFSIEIWLKGKGKGKARFWISGKQFGEFNRSHDLSYLRNGLKRLIELEKIDYEYDDFLKVSPVEFFEQCMLIASKAHEIEKEDYYLFDKVKSVTFYFGDQFDSVNHVIFLKRGVCHFVWSVNKNKKNLDYNFMKGVSHAFVSFEYVKNVISECLKWLGSEPIVIRNKK